MKIKITTLLTISLAIIPSCKPFDPTPTQTTIITPLHSTATSTKILIPTPTGTFTPTPEFVLGDDCMEFAMTQLEMNSCAGYLRKKSEQVLNNLLMEIEKTVTQKQWEEIGNNQLIWEHYSELSCLWVWDHYYLGSVAPMMRSGCQELSNIFRILQLKDLICVSDNLSEICRSIFKNYQETETRTLIIIEEYLDGNCNLGDTSLSDSTCFERQSINSKEFLNKGYQALGFNPSNLNISPRLDIVVPTDDYYLEWRGKDRKESFVDIQNIWLYMRDQFCELKNSILLSEISTSNIYYACIISHNIQRVISFRGTCMNCATLDEFLERRNP